MTAGSQGSPYGGSGQAGGEGLAALGKYHIFATLGRGGMADVYLAVARGPVGFNKLVVIKRLRAQLAEEPTFRQMFLDEARLAARLNHPNIVQTFEVGEENGTYFIAMEYLEGQALNRVIREVIKQNVAIAPPLCAKIAADALLALSYAHGLRDYDGSPLGIIHRDVSPHNVFVTYDGQVKLVDFGIAKAASTTTETEVGVLKGKVAYMAPEQALGGAIDARADVFSMGILLWELLTRQRLLPGDNAAVTLHRLMNQPIPRASSVMSLPPELDAIVARALEKDPMRRFQSAAEMRDALEGFVVRSGFTVRTDDLAALLTQLFAPVREEVQGKVRAYMAQFHRAASTNEVRALTAESLQRVGNVASGTGSSASLLRLGSSGSVMGPHGGTFPPTGSVAFAPTQQEPRRERSIILPIVIAGCFMLAIAALLVFGLRKNGDATRTVAGEPSAAASPTGATGTPTVEPSAGAAGPSSSVGAVASTSAPSTTRHPVSIIPTGRGTVAPKPSATEVPTAPATAAAEPGFLTFDTYPFTKVSENGRVLGTTPLVRVSLAPGAHTLTVENADQGIKSVVTVTIKSGETTTKRVGLK